MQQLDWVGALAHLQGLIGRLVAVRVGTGDAFGPADVLVLHTSLSAGWDLTPRGAHEQDDSVMLSFQGDSGSGILLERTAFDRASTDGRDITLWTGGLRVMVELLGDDGSPLD